MILGSTHTPVKARQLPNTLTTRPSKHVRSIPPPPPAHPQTFLLQNEQQTASFHSASEMRADCSLTRCTMESFAQADKLLLKILKNCNVRILGNSFLS